MMLAIQTDVTDSSILIRTELLSAELGKFLIITNKRCFLKVKGATLEHK